LYRMHVYIYKKRNTNNNNKLLNNLIKFGHSSKIKQIHKKKCLKKLINK
jgi:hypothetical protein